MRSRKTKKLAQCRTRLLHRKERGAVGSAPTSTITGIAQRDRAWKDSVSDYPCKRSLQPSSPRRQKNKKSSFRNFFSVINGKRCDIMRSRKTKKLAQCRRRLLRMGSVRSSVRVRPPEYFGGGAAGSAHNVPFSIILASYRVDYRHYGKKIKKVLISQLFFRDKR